MEQILVSPPPINRAQAGAEVAKNPAVQTSAHALESYNDAMLLALVAVDQDFESIGRVSCETMELVRAVLAEMGIA